MTNVNEDTQIIEAIFSERLKAVRPVSLDNVELLTVGTQAF